MAPCIRESDVTASPSTVWQTCIADLKWEKWDEDVERLEDIKGGLNKGSTLTFVLKGGGQQLSKFPCKLTSVKENEVVAYSGSVLYGLIRVWGRIEISQKSDATSHIKYIFEMNGILGSAINWYKPDPVIHGTETGLANMVRLSEKAERDCSSSS